MKAYRPRRKGQSAFATSTAGFTGRPRLPVSLLVVNSVSKQKPPVKLDVGVPSRLPEKTE